MKLQLDNREFVTFVVGELLLGAGIEHVREISRSVAPTPVPHSPAYVLGVVNLRGELVTVVDLEVVLRGNAHGTESPRAKRAGSGDCVIVSDGAEKIALMVSSIGDVVQRAASDVEETPSNLRDRDVRCYDGVVQLDGRLMVILSLERVFAAMRGESAKSQHDA